MSSANDDGEPVDVQDAAAASAAEAAPSATEQRPAAKRRTKTGCLTCRKRRIKCGEERPICKNCIKSKRECAGYVQPLVYKQHNHGPPTAIHDVGDMLVPVQDDPFAGSHPSSLPPRPPQQQYSTYHDLAPRGAMTFPQLPPDRGYYGPGQAAVPHESSYQSLPGEAGYVGWQNMQLPHFPQPGIPHDGMERMSMGGQGLLQQQMGGLPPTSFAMHGTQGAGYGIPTSSLQAVSGPAQHLTADYPSAGYLSEIPHPLFATYQHRTSLGHPRYDTPQPDVGDNSSRRYTIRGFVQQPHSIASIAPSQMASDPIPRPSAHADLVGEESDDDDDDPYDVEMDDPEGKDLSFAEAAQGLTDILGRSGQDRGPRMKPSGPARRAPQTLAEYRPSLMLSPLRDERNERIFRHFVQVTSRCIAIFERQYFAPLATGPARTLWSFTIPALALSHRALAHAILALGALHLAKLQQTSEAPAIKHFTYAVRRVGRLLGLPRRRHEIATLATVLVLGFYEVMAGDHSRWSLHLGGATKLVMEHDIGSMTRVARRMRRRAKANIREWTAQFGLTDENYVRVAGIPMTLLDDAEWEVDMTLISQLTGRAVDYDHQLQANMPDPGRTADLSEKDVEDLKAKMDLRWWYCKQDIFQSMVSGDPLMMSLDAWIYCPPRGPIGRADNAFATLDHLLLVMARITDFGGRDRARKQRAVDAQGGKWMPPPGFFGPDGPTRRPAPEEDQRRGGSAASGKGQEAVGIRKSAGQSVSKSSQAPSANEGRVRQSKPVPSGPMSGAAAAAAADGGGGPGFHGMIPPPAGPVPMHSAFQVMAATLRDSAFTGPQKEMQQKPLPGTLEADTTNALAEYADIVRAFDTLVQALGPDFEPLRPPSQAPIATPFGPALIYRNSAIACIWTIYYVGRILLHRLHPYMPPAAMVAAGVTAHLTRDYGQKVGKICGGLYSSHQYGQTGPLDPTLAGAWMESTFSLLFAGVQYQDPVQRGWTISKLQDVAHTCGWQTSAAIAAACENAWEKMGQAGRGPPYQRTLNRNKDFHVNVTSRGVVAGAVSSTSDAMSEHESQFVNHDRGLIGRYSSTRVHWALGLLSVEEDIQKISLESN